MKRLLFIGLMLLGLYACQEKKRSAIEVHVAPGKEWLDSTHKANDTTFSKRYGGTDFYTAEYNVNRATNTLTQVMFDSLGHITQIIALKNNKRVLFGEYYSNGQMRSKLLLDSAGQFDGLAKYYYETGRIQREGEYKHGVFAGTWSTYDKDGYLKATEKYGEDGELLATEKAQ